VRMRKLGRCTQVNLSRLAKNFNNVINSKYVSFVNMFMFNYVVVLELQSKKVNLAKFFLN